MSTDVEREAVEYMDIYKQAVCETAFAALLDGEPLVGAETDQRLAAAEYVSHRVGVPTLLVRLKPREGGVPRYFTVRVTENI